MVREQCYHGRSGSLKTRNRRRAIPLARVLVNALAELRRISKSASAEDAVFAGKARKPIWAHSLEKRTLKPKAVELKVPWLSWHVFRHVFRHKCATLTKSFGMLDVDRRSLMGHSDADMTERYTHEDFERMRSKMEEIAVAITKPPADAAPANVVVMKRRSEDNFDSELTSKEAELIEAKGAAS